MDEGSPQKDEASSEMDDPSPQTDGASSEMDEGSPKKDEASPQKDEGFPQKDGPLHRRDGRFPGKDGASTRTGERPPESDEPLPQRARRPTKPYQRACYCPDGMSQTAEALAKIPSDSFERLASAVLRRANPLYQGLIHTGMNTDGQTVKSRPPAFPPRTRRSSR